MAPCVLLPRFAGVQRLHTSTRPLFSFRTLIASSSLAPRPAPSSLPMNFHACGLQPISIACGFPSFPIAFQKRYSSVGSGMDGSDGSGGHNNGGGRNNGGGGSGNGSEDSSSNFSFWSWYMDMLGKYPVITKGLTSAFLTLAGDLFCQFIVEKKDELDLRRTSVFTSLGLVLVGPALHFWYLCLSKLIRVGGVAGASFQLAVDQLLFSPAFIAVFFSALLTLEGRSADIMPKLQQDWASAVIANWKLWVPFQFLNFLFVPQQLRVAAANVIALAWNVYLSFATHTDVGAGKNDIDSKAT